MHRQALTVQETQEMLLYVCQHMVESKDILTQADKAVGDGDHGVGMARGFEAVHQKLTQQDFTTIAQIFAAVGTALMTSVGGAAGAIFGTLFRAGAKSLGDQTDLDSSSLASILSHGLQAVQDRGHAQVGDKTMVDALEPAARKARELATMPIDTTLAEVAAAAEQGMESTKHLVATTGKTKTLGGRSLGHPDPGAVSTYLILSSMAEYVTGK